MNTATTAVRATFLSLALVTTLSVLAGLHQLSSGDAHADWARAQQAATQQA
ncbi:MAG: hypothetical protein ACKVQR_14865 [Aquabacterium sp.]